MAKIRNSSMKNWYGDGHEQIFTADNGKEYTIRNSSMKNWYGDGHEQIVEERSKGSSIICAGNTTLIIIASLSFLGAVISIVNGFSFTAPCMIVGFICVFIDIILGYLKIGG